jgi:16S rRNA (uracil1498-N3)-methyltransferase
MQRYFACSKKENLFFLSDGDLHHISNVMRMKSGDFIEVVFEKKLYKCKVVFNKSIDIIYDSLIDCACINGPYISLVVPVLKEQKMDYVLQKATELGVSEVIPIITERTIVKLNDKEFKKIERWNRIVKEASEQCKRIDVPIISSVKKISDLKFFDGVKFVCSTRKNEKSFKKLMHNVFDYDKMYIVVGPEGGLSIEEEEELNKLGFNSVSLGNRIMRVETVPLFVLSVINYELLE